MKGDKEIFFTLFDIRTLKFNVILIKHLSTLELPRGS